MNRVCLDGRLTKDIEMKVVGNNHTSVARFTVACNRHTKEGGADFINCVAWGKSAEFLNQYAHKGDSVVIEGHITTGSYEGQNGKVFTVDVTVDSVELHSFKRDKEVKEEPKTETKRDDSHYMDDASLFNDLEFNSDDLPFE